MSLDRYVIIKNWSGKRLLLPLYFLLSVSIYAQPGVVTQPSDTSICVGSSALFSIVAVNTSAYQWQENDGVGWYNLTDDFTYVDGQFTPNLSINDANIGLNNYSYRCIVSDLNNDTDTSEAALLKVYEPPIITLDPINEVVCKNNVALFSVEAINGTDYKWQEYSGVGWINLSNNSFYSGTDSPDLSIFTTTGMNGFKYRCIVKNVSCPDTSSSAELQVNQTPIIYTIAGGGEYCAGGTGVEINLDESQVGISYNLVKDGIETGIVKDGTGSSISFGIITESGNYTAFAYNQFTGCTVEMSSSVNVIENPLPMILTLQGGGNICEGEEGENIFLISSETDIEYALYLNGNYSGQTIIGTGFAISFGKHNEEGLYTVIATNPITSCSIQMEGNAQIVVEETPVALAGPDKTINSGEKTQLNGDAINGSGEYLFNWSPEYLVDQANAKNTETQKLISSETFLLNIIDAQSGCISKPDSTIVYISGGHLSVNINSSATETCMGDSISLLAIPTGGNGDYEFEWTSYPEGFTSDIANPSIIANSNRLYIVSVLSDNMEAIDSIQITVFDKPQIFELQGGGELCDGYQGVNIKLNSSQDEVIYQVFRNENDLVSEKIGNGNEIDFGEFDVNGIYTSKAYTLENNCKSDMLGSAVIIKKDRVFADAGNDKVINLSEGTSLNGSAIGGSGNYEFNWSPETKIINPSDQSPSTVELFQSTLFELIVTDQISNCDSDRSNVIVFVGGDFPVDIEFITQSENLCPGEEKSILALPSGGSGYYTYYWTSNPAGFFSSENEINVSPTEDTWYIVEISDGINFTKDSLEIKTLPEPQIFNLSGGGGYCPDEQGVNVYLDGSESGTNYSLYYNTQPSGTILVGTGNQLNFGKMITEGNYSVRAKNQNGCVSLMSNAVQVVKNNKPIKYQLFGGGTYCDNDPTLGLLLESSQINVNYELFRDAISTGSIIEGNGLPLSFTDISENGLYTVSAINSINGCSENMTGVIPLLINQIPNISIEGNNEICFGDTTLITAYGGITYIWNTIPPINNSQIEVAPEVSTTYTVIASNNTNCKSTDSITVSVNERPDIYLENDLLSSSIICNPSGYANYDFYFSDELIQSGTSNVLMYSDLSLTNDTISVVASNSASCTDIASIYLETIDIPNAFSPDGDGRNEIFLEGFDIKVFSRWGKELYSGTEGWDGYFKGKVVTPGTYYYVLYIHDYQGNIVNTKKGSVTVVIN